MLVVCTIKPDGPDKGNTPLRALQDHYEVQVVAIGEAQDCLDRLALDDLDLDYVTGLEFGGGEKLGAPISVDIGFALRVVTVAEVQDPSPKGSATLRQAQQLVIFTVS